MERRNHIKIHGENSSLISSPEDGKIREKIEAIVRCKGNSFPIMKKS